MLRQTAVKLEDKDCAAAARLAALCMADNIYYKRMFPALDAEERTGCLTRRMSVTIGHCISHGEAVGVFDGAGALAAYEYMADYGILKKDFTNMYDYIFGIGKETAPSHFSKLLARLDAMLDAGRKVTYVLGCGVAASHRKSPRVLGAMAHYNLRLLKSCDVIAADFTNKALLDLCALHGPFEIEKLAPDYWLLLRS